MGEKVGSRLRPIQGQRVRGGLRTAYTLKDRDDFQTKHNRWSPTLKRVCNYPFCGVPTSEGWYSRGNVKKIPKD